MNFLLVEKSQFTDAFGKEVYQEAVYKWLLLRCMKCNAFGHSFEPMVNTPQNGNQNDRVSTQKRNQQTQVKAKQGQYRGKGKAANHVVLEPTEKIVTRNKFNSLQAWKLILGKLLEA